MRTENGWIIDANNNNRASIEYWGSEEKARESLLSLKDCKDCTNCWECSNCSRCINEANK